MERLTPEQIDSHLNTALSSGGAVARLVAGVFTAELKERNTPCVWSRTTDGDQVWYETGCHKDSPSVESAFCPNCGHPVQVKEE